MSIYISVTTATTPTLAACIRRTGLCALSTQFTIQRERSTRGCCLCAAPIRSFVRQAYFVTFCFVVFLASVSAVCRFWCNIFFSGSPPPHPVSVARPSNVVCSSRLVRILLRFVCSQLVQHIPLPYHTDSMYVCWYIKECCGDTQQASRPERQRERESAYSAHAYFRVGYLCFVPLACAL